MVEANSVPSDYCVFSRASEDFYAFNQAEFVPCQFISAAQEGWVTTIPDDTIELLQDRADIEDSVRALNEPRGVELNELKRELGM